MKKNIFLKNIITLIIGTLLTRLLGFVIRIIFTRSLNADGINLYSLVLPTYSLFLALTQMGLPVAISTIVARNKVSFKKIATSILPVIIILNIVMILIILNTAPYIACNLLNNSDAILPIKSMSLVLPFVSISSLLKGYYFGKQKMYPYTISNVLEQIVRLGIILLILPKLLLKGYIYAVSGFIALSVLSEIVQILIFLLFLPNRINIKNIKYDNTITKDILSLSVPSIGGRLLGNVLYFLEPVILIKTLMFFGYSNGFIVNEYGIYNAYTLPLLMIPSFLVQAVSTALVPEISKAYSKNDKYMIKKRLKQSLTITFSLSVLTNIIVFLFPEFLLDIIYNTTKGATYIKCLAFAFAFYNLEGPLNSALSAINKPKEAFMASSIGAIIKTIFMIILSPLKIGIYTLIIGEILNIFTTIFLSFRYLKKAIG